MLVSILGDGDAAVMKTSLPFPHGAYSLVEETGNKQVNK